MDEQIKILCVDDENNVLRALKRLFMDDDYEIFTAESGSEGIEVLEKEEGIQLIISDYRMPGMDGVEFLRQAHEGWPETIRIVLSGYADTAVAVAAINEGQIYKFIAKPWNDDELRVTIEKALEVFFLRRKNENLAEELMASNEELTELNNNLEEEVTKRTADLLFQNKAMQFAHNVMNSLPAAVIGLDPDGLIVLSNALSESLFKKDGLSPGGRSAAQALPPEVMDMVNRIRDTVGVDEKITLFQKSYLLKGVKFATDQKQAGTILVFVPVESDPSTITR